jgi:hypothetical protein
MNNFETHVRLIIAQEGVAKNKARMMAWLEGPEGLKRREVVA